MDHLDLASEHGGGGVAATCREMIISGFTLSLMRSRKSQ